MTDILARQRQLVGTTAQWALNDLIIGDGEYALERTTSGKIKVKVGNGVLTFSALPYNVEAFGAFGSGYTWRDLTASRADNTEYTSPDHPIQVSYRLHFSTSPSTMELWVEDQAGGAGTLVSVAWCGNGGNGEMLQTITAIVPPNTVYRSSLGGAAFNARHWRELRAD